MICEKCGKELPDNSKFCTQCGASLDFQTIKSNPENSIFNGLKGKITDVIVYGYGLKEKTTDAIAFGYKQDETYLSSSSYNTIFVEPDEQLLGSLGNGWVTNVLFSKLEKCNALLTDKRVYLQGTFFSGSGKSIDRKRYENIIDLEDITGSGFIYSDQMNMVLMILLPIAIAALTGNLMNSVVGFIGFIGGVIIDLVYYLMHRTTYFFIEYAGGRIRFDATILGISTVKDFQRQIRRAKDKAKGKLK